MKYNLKISERARVMRLEIRRNGELVVTVPRGVDYSFIERFIAQKSSWIADKLRYFESTKDKLFLNTSRREYIKYKESARLLAENRIAHYSKFYNFKIHPVKSAAGAAVSAEGGQFNGVNRISIKNTKSRWGSCSQKGNLNFNYKIALLPAHLADYIIVHELCHLGEMNHSKKFWQLVSLTIPNYRELRSKFKK